MLVCDASMSDNEPMTVEKPEKGLDALEADLAAADPAEAPEIAEELASAMSDELDETPGRSEIAEEPTMWCFIKSRMGRSGLPQTVGCLPAAVAMAATIAPDPIERPSGMGNVASVLVAMKSAPERMALAARSMVE